MGLKEAYAQLKAEFERKRAELVAATTITLKAMANQLFEQYPELASFGWRQYTPYFNDGDECIFSVRSDYPDVRFVDGTECADLDDLRWRVHQGHEPNRHEQAALAVLAFLRTFDDDILKELFGDHVRVTITPTETLLQRCDHD